MDPDGVLDLDGVLNPGRPVVDAGERRADVGSVESVPATVVGPSGPARQVGAPRVGPGAMPCAPAMAGVARVAGLVAALEALCRTHVGHQRHRLPTMARVSRGVAVVALSHVGDEARPAMANGVPVLGQRSVMSQPAVNHVAGRDSMSSRGGENRGRTDRRR